MRKGHPQMTQIAQIFKMVGQTSLSVIPDNAGAAFSGVHE